MKRFVTELNVKTAWSNEKLPWLEEAFGRNKEIIEKKFNNGNIKNWEMALQNLPFFLSPKSTPTQFGTYVGLQKFPESSIPELKTNLTRLCPWRKGPFKFGSLIIDAEWQSNMKWNRFKNEIDLRNKRVLDIGCGSGYFMWRMLEKGANEILGIDPNLLFSYQFACIHELMGRHPLALFPLSLEEFQNGDLLFDTIFDMGVLYHRRDPFGHLKKIFQLLEKTGTLILETLVIPGGANSVLVPKNRYARMNNVWFLPSVKTLFSWLERSHFNQIRVLDISTTNSDEQRKTRWMQNDSFESSLDSRNPIYTIEGLPRPRRATILARK